MKKLGNNNIKIEQTFHGYSNGHKLIKFSKTLSNDAERTMLLLSDLSGSSIENGFDSYITGYPLKNDSYFVLSKTWYASEMERPGCVWTHSLLIHFSDLSQISNLSFLNNYFIRPSNENDLDLYESSIEVNINQLDNKNNYFENNIVSENKLKEILFNLYTYFDKSIYVTTKNSAIYEYYLLYMWSQQWPKLRRSFTFCTGALSNRKVFNTSFDLQFIPQQQVDTIKRENPSGIFIDNLDSENYGNDWIVFLFYNLYNENQEFKKFLWTYGIETKNGRKDFSKLVLIYLMLKKINDIESLRKLIEHINDYFPKCNEFNYLKIFLFGSYRKSNDYPLINFSEEEILTEIITTSHNSGYDPNKLLIRKRSEEFWKKNNHKSIKIISNMLYKDFTNLGKEFIIGVVESIKENEMELLSNEMLLLFVNINCHLLLFNSTWQRQKKVQTDIFDLVMSFQNKLNNEENKQIINIILSKKINIPFQEMIDCWGEFASEQILDWFDELNIESPDSIPDNFKQVLLYYPSKLLNWLEIRNHYNISTIALIIESLDPFSKIVHKIGSSIWIKLLKYDLSKIDEKNYIYMMSFLLSLGFQNIDSNAYKLVDYSFDTVYNAAGENKLDYKSWNNLKKLLPELFWWENWDKCKRLKKAKKG